MQRKSLPNQLLCAFSLNAAEKEIAIAQAAFARKEFCPQFGKLVPVDAVYWKCFSARKSIKRFIHFVVSHVDHIEKGRLRPTQAEITAHLCAEIVIANVTIA